MYRRIFVGALALLAVNSVNAQNSVSDVLADSTDTKPYFAAFDLRPSSVSSDAAREVLASVFREKFSGITINQQLPSYPLPKAPLRMNFVAQQSPVGMINVPECPGATAIIKGTDRTMAQYGELSVVQACVFPYSQGLRVNVYAVYALKSGGSNPVLWGASLGRMLTKAVGLGDSTRTIVRAIDDIESRLKEISPTIALVELSPQREGKQVMADPAQTQAMESPAAVPTLLGGTSVEPAAAPARPTMSPTFAGLPPETARELQQGLALAQQQFAAQMAASGTGVNAATPTQATATTQVNGVITARKELTAMGFSYFNQDQFVDAIQRGDRIACELFLKAGGISPTKPNSAGLTPVKAATQPEIVALIDGYRQGKPD